MAYNSANLTKLSALQALAQRAEAAYAKKTDLQTLKTTVDGIVATGGEANVIEGVSVNGTAATITDKVAAITVPTKTSDITNDSGYQTASEVASAVASADHLKRKIVASTADIDLTADDADQYIYMVPKNGAEDGDTYDEYMVISGALERVGDWSVDLSDYATTEQVNKELASYATSESVESGLAEKVNTADIATDEEVAEMLDEVFGSSEA